MNETNQEKKQRRKIPPETHKLNDRKEERKTWIFLSSFSMGEKLHRLKDKVQ